MALQIAIDGPVGAGKGVVAKSLADRLGLIYVDTGATYRVATLLAVRAGLDFDKLDREVKAEVEKLEGLVRGAKIEMKPVRGVREEGRLVTVWLDGEDVSEQIRTEALSTKVPVVAKLPMIRKILVEKQQEIAFGRDVVMEGRDITYRVLPQAQVKIYLDADLEERVERRLRELNGKGEEEIGREELRQKVMARDKADMSREADPLKLVDGAWRLDTTKLSVEEVVAVIVGRIEQEEVRNLL